MNSQECSSSFGSDYQIQQQAVAAANAYPTLFSTNPIRRSILANSQWEDQLRPSSPNLAPGLVSVPPPTPTLYFHPSEWDAGPSAGTSAHGCFSSRPTELNVQSLQSRPQNIGGKTNNNKWTEAQTAVLVHEWKENIQKIESSRNVEAWNDLTLQVNQAGPKKTPKQCKDKIKNLKQAFKDARPTTRKAADHRSGHPSLRFLTRSLEPGR